ncbi:hypothetical protein DFH07DRAFT_769282 [Mycena maculata]|uniref:Uncharacterized protein n=1 Tax=Mycena maculata TaxID=230809 RepID=A0AAD7JMZ7_9AGAR|nr:hypothetical protein DFH07DRAFT_769282 [Mycena maculata]
MDFIGGVMGHNILSAPPFDPFKSARKGNYCHPHMVHMYTLSVYNQAFVSFEPFVPQWDEGNRYNRAKEPGGRLPHFLPLWDSAEKKIQQERINPYLSASLGSNKLNYAKVAGYPVSDNIDFHPFDLNVEFTHIGSKEQFSISRFNNTVEEGSK